MNTIPSTDQNHHTSRLARAKRSEAILPNSVDDARWIPLAGGRFALVDEEDYDRVSVYNWCSYFNGRVPYAQCDHVTMHHFILKVALEIDHKNLNGLDNRKENLRICSHSENGMNRPKRRTPTSSKFKGVSFARNVGKWHAEITIRPKRWNLGYFINEEDAARAYDKAALEKFGEFSILNFPRDTA